jgi:SAM-dependent methyltransferase
MSRARPQPAVHPFDREHGTDTSGLLPAHVIAKGTEVPLEHLTAYYGIAPSILQSLLDLWLQRIHPQTSIEHFTFLDVGAGKGRAIMLASRYPFAAVQGIELSPALVAVGKRNLALWRDDPHAEALAPIELLQADATRHPLPHTPTLAFLFHPFEAPVLRRFLRHVEKSQRRAPSPFDLIYANSEHGSLLDSHPAFQCLWEGRIAMSSADHVADLEAIAQQKEYGSTGDELCAIYRFLVRKRENDFFDK